MGLTNIILLLINVEQPVPTGPLLNLLLCATILLLLMFNFGVASVSYRKY